MKVRFWLLRLQFLMDFVNFDNICHVILKKSFFFGEYNCLSKQTKKRYQSNICVF